VGKNTLRKKVKRPANALRFDQKNPGQVGVPCEVYLIEHLCMRCRAGFMRPSGKVLEIAPGRPGLVHQCTNEVCGETHTFAAQYPRPEFSPTIDVHGAARTIGNMLLQMQEQIGGGDGPEEDPPVQTDTE
jgi:hypothetical protein